MDKRTQKTSRAKPAKRLVLLSLSAALLVFGLWFSGTNAASFLKGYLLFKSGQAENDSQMIEPAAAAAAPKVEIPEKSTEPITETQTGKASSSDGHYPETPKKGQHMGDLYIPKLDATLPIFHGTDEEELEKGVGHFAESVMPGENDNAVLSGHRDTVFRKLGEVGKGDLLVVQTAAGKFTYKVRQVRIVDQDDRTVIVPKPKATLTVSTCYPFDFVGFAPDRYILVADLIASE